jgi:opacity protein-like surface antigen
MLFRGCSMKRFLAGLALLTLATPAVAADDVTGIIVQFTGTKVNGVEASTKNKEFKPVFEKDLKAVAEKLPGKPDVKLTDWFTIINGGAIKWTGGDKGTAGKLKAALEKLPYVKMVELDIPTPPPGP